jgi:hypothetical protein
MEEKKDNLEQLTNEVLAIRKRQRLLKILTIFLSFCIIAILSVTYIFYRNYKRFVNSINSPAISSDEFNKSVEIINKAMDDLYKNNPNYQVPSVSTFSSLSLIGFSSDVVSAMRNEKIKEDVEDIAKEVVESEDVKKFFNKLKDDKDFKEIFGAKDEEKPLILYKKMQDPRFVGKYTKIIMSDPALLKSLMKLVMDPRMQNMMKNIPSNLDDVKISTKSR